MKRQKNTGSSCNTNFQALFRLVQARQGEIKERESKVFFRMKSNGDERDEFSGGWKALGFRQKYLNLCFEDERRSYGFGTT